MSAEKPNEKAAGSAVRTEKRGGSSEVKTYERILVVDDSVDTLEVLRRNLESAGFVVACTTGVKEAIDRLAQQPVDLVVTDLKMPGISGLELIRHVRENLRLTEILMITGYPSIESAVESMRLGAADYLPKPFTGAELLGAVDRVLQRRRELRRRGAVFSPELPGFLAAGPAMRAVTRRIRELATATAVLIAGEQGTGRRTVAWHLHACGPRAALRWRHLDCAEIPPECLESQLLGAATPALPTGSASITEGTVYLSGAQALSRPLQLRLAHGIEDGTGPALIFSLEPEIERRQGAVFESALSARLAESRIDLPPLREREEDLPLLIDHLAGRSAEELGLSHPEISNAAIEALRRYGWPGNLTELRWVIRQAVARAGGASIDLPDLPSALRGTSVPLRSVTRPLAEVEVEYIREVLASVDGNRSRAAEILGIDRKTLREKLRRDDAESDEILPGDVVGG